MKQSNPQIFTINLSKIEGKGEFPCPNCGVAISPDDESDDVYSILETKIHSDALEELVIQCNKCGSKIRLTGFIPQN